MSSTEPTDDEEPIVPAVLEDGFGFAWGQTGETVWVRNEDGSYKRIEPTFLEDLRRFARVEQELRSASPSVVAAIVTLHKEGYLTPGGDVRRYETATDVRLIPRLGVFAALFATFLLFVWFRWESIVELPQVIEPSPTLGLRVAVALAFFIVCHEFGHYLASRQHFAPAFGVTLLNGCIPAVVTRTSDAWACPRSVRIWISLAGPFVDLVIATALAATFVMVPDKPLVGLLAVIVAFRMIFSLNPLLNGDGYWILVDLFELHNLRTQGFRDLRAGRGSGPAAYAALVAVFTGGLLLLLGVILWTVLAGGWTIATTLLIPSRNCNWTEPKQVSNSDPIKRRCAGGDDRLLDTTVGN